MSTQLAPSPTLDDAIEIAILLHDLESLDECRCEVPDHRGLTCGIHVVAFLRYQCAPEDEKKVCKPIVQAFDEMRLRGVNCQCGTPVADCWSAIPI